MKFTLLPFLVALIVGIAPTAGFHASYKVARRNTGFTKIAPWLQRSAESIATTAASWLNLTMSFLRARPNLVAATLVMALCLAQPDASIAMVGIVGQVAISGTNTAAMERDLLRITGEASTLLEKTMRECQAFEQKDKDGKTVATGRPMTEDESKAVQALIDKGNGLKAQIERAKGDENMAREIEKLTAGMTKPNANGNGGAQPRETRSLGEQYVASEDYLKFVQPKAAQRATKWASNGVELNATVLDTGSGSGADLIVTEYRPGIVPLLFKRLVVADLLASGTTNSSSVTYMKESSFTNAADSVAQGAPKPESTLVFTKVADLVEKIAHWLPVTDEMLEDVAQIRSYIDARLRLGLGIAEEDQLLNGSGTSPDIDGLLNRDNLTTATVRSGSTTNADAIYTAMMAVFNASFVMPTGTIMNPANWQTTQLSKDGNGNYYGSGPFAGAQPPTLWGLPVVVTPSIVANTAFTGAFNSAAQVFRKGGVRLEASNSHSDFFVRNLTAIRCEERLALAVYRPAAFSKITSLT